jgi:uncharacterized protein YkwD
MCPTSWWKVLLVLLLVAGCSGQPAPRTLPAGTASPTAFMPLGPSPRPREDSLGPDLVATMAADMAAESPARPPAHAAPTADALLLAVNTRRVEAGLPGLKSTPELTRIAQLRAEDMLVRDYFGHLDPISGTPLVELLLKSEGFTGRVAENLYATDAPEKDVVDQVVSAWFESPSHRANLLDPNLVYTGVGLAGDGTWWKVCQVFAQRAPG